MLIIPLDRPGISENKSALVDSANNSGSTPGQQNPKDSPTVRSPPVVAPSSITSSSPVPMAMPMFDSFSTLSFIINTNGMTITTVEHLKFLASGRSNSCRGQSIKIPKTSCFLGTDCRKIFSCFISPMM